MSNAEQSKKSGIRMDGRSYMSIVGVTEVLSFDDTAVHLMTVDGELYVEGSDMRVGMLNTQGGEIDLSGKIDGTYYVGDSDKKKGFFSRLTR